MNFNQLRNLPPKDLAEQIEMHSRDKVGDLVNGEELSGLICSTNATGWYLDTLEVDTSSIDLSDDAITATAHVSFAGDQDEDSGPLGDQISGTVSIAIGPELQVAVSDVDCEIDDE